MASGLVHGQEAKGYCESEEDEGKLPICGRICQNESKPPSVMAARMLCHFSLLPKSANPKMPDEHKETFEGSGVPLAPGSVRWCRKV
ncbi:hypothetical protein P7K49_029546 [Saguinus oedipus]|uniref:Uncharacterized protein n=1 Tax=Saguinus oedipus TaxID=9490 RepID=A0ABQ9U7H9_SAGOE|nr:hypothetical protein P7K49_029546 [Saguinus oedipus]